MSQKQIPPVTKELLDVLKNTDLEWADGNDIDGYIAEVEPGGGAWCACAIGALVESRINGLTETEEEYTNAMHQVYNEKKDGMYRIVKQIESSLDAELSPHHVLGGNNASPTDEIIYYSDCSGGFLDTRNWLIKKLEKVGYDVSKF